MTQNARKAVFLIPAALICSITGLAGAQDIGEQADHVEEIAHAEEPGIVLTLDVDASFYFEADFDTNVGTIESSSLGAEAGMLIPIDDRSQLLLSFGADLTEYDITPATGAIGTTVATVGTQFDTVTELRGDVLYTRAVDAKWSFFAGGGIGLAAEGDASNASTWNVIGGVVYQVNEKLRVGGGLGVYSQIEDDVLIVPLPQVHYQIDERWSVQSKGAGGKLDYKWNDKLSMGILGQFEGQTFRIDSDNTLVPNGSVTMTGFPVSYYLDYSAGEQSQVSIFAQIGVVLEGKMEILNNAGTTVVDEIIDTGVFGAVGVRIRF